MTADRYPLDPLLDAMGIKPGRHGGQQPRVGHPLWPSWQRPADPNVNQDLEGLTVLAARLGVSERMARRMQADGLSERQADRFAVAIGRLPQLVWPEYRDSAPGEDDLIAKRCRCKPADRVPLAGMCDRCGRTIAVANTEVASDAA